jgi:tetratricopeptide (TPR) repeat protein
MLRARNPDEDVCAVGQRLDAATLLSGSVQRDGARLRVTFRWVNANDCYQILADSYERMLDDIFEVQHAISEAIVRRLARALGTDLTSVQPAGPPPSPEAYQPFLLGRHNLILGRYDLEHRGEESIRRSIKLFQDAIQRDADLAEAYLSLAEAYMLLPSYADTLANDQEPMNSALAALERVEELDGNSNRTYAARAFIHTLNLEWIEAERLFRAAIALQPNDANLRHRYSQFLGRVGYTDRSLGQAKLARDLDDVSPVLKSRLATAYVGAGYNDLAAEQFALARAAGMVSAVNVGSGLVLLYRQKKFEEMVRLISALQNEKGLSTKWVAAVVEALQHPDDAEANRLGMAEFAQAAEAGDLYPRLHWGALICVTSAHMAPPSPVC